jgi:hypothetical protein
VFGGVDGLKEGWRERTVGQFGVRVDGMEKKGVVSFIVDAVFERPLDNKIGRLD